MTPQEKKREQHLLKRYNLTLAEYKEMAAAGCALCGRQGATRSLNVDHCHRTEKAKVEAIGSKKTGWSAWSQYEFGGYYATGKTRLEAVRAVKRHLLRISVRGTLCWRHNRGIEMFGDSPDLLRAAATYLERYKNNV
jgi:hypothetical protein